MESTNHPSYNEKCRYGENYKLVIFFISLKNKEFLRDKLVEKELYCEKFILISKRIHTSGDFNYIIKINLMIIL